MQLLEYAYTEPACIEDVAITFKDDRLFFNDSKPYSTDIVICDYSVERTGGDRVLTGWGCLTIDAYDWDENLKNEELSSYQLLREWADSNTWI